MTRHSYRERDYAFGQVMLKLRTSIGLAALLGVSRRAVGKWEASNNYPKAERLQHFIGLCVQQHVFAPEREEEEIRALWKTAHQRELLDETWLSTQATLMLTSTTEVRATSNQTPAMESAAFPRIDWVGALDVSRFTGHEGELAALSQWVVQEHCRLVAILGMSGIGKSALVSLLGKQLGRSRVVLHGHSAAVTGQAFTPDNRSLLSGSEDGTLRLWEVQHGEALRVLEGYEAALYDVD